MEGRDLPRFGLIRIVLIFTGDRPSNPLKTSNAPSMESGLGCIGRLTLVSKCLSEIASTGGTIWIVCMMCEREQQIGGG